MDVKLGPIRGMRWRIGSSVHSCWLGSYEAAKFAVVARAVRPGMTVFDIGANAGYYTLLFSRLVGQRGNVVAVDPLPAEPPSVVKMDIEGGESDALVGAQGLLRERQTTWFIALHGAEERQRCGEILVAAGYSLRSLEGEKVEDLAA
jgi:hypothetical protein